MRVMISKRMVEWSLIRESAAQGTPGNTYPLNHRGGGSPPQLRGGVSKSTCFTVFLGIILLVKGIKKHPLNFKGVWVVRDAVAGPPW